MKRHMVILIDVLDGVRSGGIGWSCDVMQQPGGTVAPSAQWSRSAAESKRSEGFGQQVETAESFYHLMG